MTYPNQFEMKIIKKREEEVFLMIDWKDITTAGNVLSASAFKLFLYLSKNKDGYNFYFSPKDFINNFEMSDKTYRNARLELIEKGYLVQDGNKLTFNSKGGLNIDPERLREQILELDKELEVIDMQAEMEYKEYLTKKNLKQFKEDNVPISLYIAALKEALNHGYEIKNKYSSIELKDII